MVRGDREDGLKYPRGRRAVRGLVRHLRATGLLRRARASGRPDAPQVSLAESYRLLFRDVRALYRTDRNAVRFLIASALFRDGLVAIFALGGVLAVTVYGLPQASVSVFGVAANVVAAAGALVLGRVEDVVGPSG